MNPRKSIDSKATTIMVFVSLIWGLQQVAMKLALPDIPPAFQVVLRSGIASILVIALIKMQNGNVFLKGMLRAGLFLGVLYSLNFICVSEALLYTPTSRLVVFMYTGPFFTALGLHLKMPEERLYGMQWIGMIIAFLGIIFAFYNPEQAGKNEYPYMLYGDILGLTSGFFSGVSTIAIRISNLSEAPPTNTMLYQLGMAFLLLIPFSFFTGQAHANFTLVAVSSLIFQVLIVAFCSFLLWMWLLRNYLASPLGVLLFMVPVYGVILGVVLLGEPLQPNFVIGSLLVLLGIIIVNGYCWFRQTWLKLGNYKKLN